jgi:hypothetical protein
MKHHALEAKIKAFIDSLDHQPSFAEFIDHFKNDPNLVELMVISSLYLDYDASSLIKDFFANSKDSEKIEELMEKYEGHPELEEFFIPKNAMSASLYKDRGFEEKAKELVEELFNSDKTSYLQDLYNIRDLLFDSLINLEVQGCTLDPKHLVDYVQQNIINQNASPLNDEENQLSFEHFYFYKLNYFSQIIDAESVQDLLEKYNEENKLSLVPINNFSTFLSGDFKPQGVLFKINLRGFDNLFKGLSYNVKVKTSLKDIAKNITGNTVKDAVTNIVTDYLVDKIPMAREIKAGKEILNAIVNSSLEMVDVSSIVSELREHQNELLKLNTSVKDYYINHYLADEFKKFFEENNIDYIHSELKPLYERLYATFIQSVNSLLTPEAEQTYLSKNSKLDLDTQKFLAVCRLITETNFYKTQIKMGQSTF